MCSHHLPLWSGALHESPTVTKLFAITVESKLDKLQVKLKWFTMWSILSDAVQQPGMCHSFVPILASCGAWFLHLAFTQSNFIFTNSNVSKRAVFFFFSPPFPSSLIHFSKVPSVDSVCFSSSLMSLSFQLAAVGWENTKPEDKM